MFNEPDLFKSTLTCQDMKDFNESQMRVFELMSDGNWHDAIAIRAAAQGSEGLRRLRELRSKGYVIDKRKTAGGGRLFEYRMHGNPSQDSHQPSPLDSHS